MIILKAVSTLYAIVVAVAVCFCEALLSSILKKLLMHPVIKLLLIFQNVAVVENA